MKRKYQKLRDSARGRDCTVLAYPYCGGNIETTVLAHLPSDAGMGMKSPDYWAVFACSSCHDLIDGRIKHDISDIEVERLKQRALYRTWQYWISEGIIQL